MVPMSQMKKTDRSVFGVGTESQANTLHSAQSLKLNQGQAVAYP